jgi:hypothetical protein
VVSSVSLIRGGKGWVDHGQAFYARFLNIPSPFRFSGLWCAREVSAPGKPSRQDYISEEESYARKHGKGNRSMTDNPVELDEHRGMAAQKLTEIRRRLHEVQADQAALRRRQEEFECHALAAPSTQAAADARYLILLFAETSEARNPRRQELIAKVLDDLARLSD